MTDRPTVMISSTALDLPEHREQVRLACERAGAAPHALMENLTAEDANAVEVSLRMVEEADIYICILAHRYGLVPLGEDISITEMEYDKAVELGRPRLVFFMDDEHPVSPKHVEKGAGAEKLDRLKARIGQERVAAFFTTPEDLRGHVVEALANLLPTLGEDKTSTQRSQENLHRRGAIPQAPAEYVAHVYTLLQAQDLVGRQLELRLLTDWVSEPASAAYRARIFNLIAIGGMGKSALTWKWFREIAPQ